MDFAASTATQLSGPPSKGRKGALAGPFIHIDGAVANKTAHLIETYLSAPEWNDTLLRIFFPMASVLGSFLGLGSFHPRFES